MGAIKFDFEYAYRLVLFILSLEVLLVNRLVVRSVEISCILLVFILEDLKVMLSMNGLSLRLF